MDYDDTDTDEKLDGSEIRLSPYGDDGSASVGDISHGSFGEGHVSEVPSVTPVLPEDPRLTWFLGIAKRLLDSGKEGSDALPVFDTESREMLVDYLDSPSDCRQMLLLSLYEAEIEKTKKIFIPEESKPDEDVPEEAQKVQEVVKKPRGDVSSPSGLLSPQNPQKSSVASSVAPSINGSPIPKPQKGMPPLKHTASRKTLLIQGAEKGKPQGKGAMPAGSSRSNSQLSSRPISPSKKKAGEIPKKPKLGSRMGSSEASHRDADEGRKKKEPRVKSAESTGTGDSSISLGEEACSVFQEVTSKQQKGRYETITERHKVAFLVVTLGHQSESPAEQVPRWLAMKRLTSDPVFLPSSATDAMSVDQHLANLFEFHSIAPHQVLGFLTILQTIHLPLLMACGSAEEVQNTKKGRIGRRRGNREIRWAAMLNVFEKYMATLERVLRQAELEKEERARLVMEDFQGIKDTLTQLALGDEADPEATKNVLTSLSEWLRGAEECWKETREMHPQREEPLTEVDHWLDRLAKLLAIAEAMKSSVPPDTIHLLKQISGKMVPREAVVEAEDDAQSAISGDVQGNIGAFIDHFYYIQNEVNADISRARDTLRILQALHSYFKDLAGNKPLTHLADTLMSMFIGFLALWDISVYYGKDENMLVLIECVIRTIAFRVARELNLKVLFDNPLPEIRESLRVVASLMHLWKEIYLEVRDTMTETGSDLIETEMNAFRRGTRRWEFDRRRIFQRTDCTATICTDLEFVVQVEEEFYSILGRDLTAAVNNPWKVTSLRSRVDSIAAGTLKQLPFDPFLAEPQSTSQDGSNGTPHRWRSTITSFQRDIRFLESETISFLKETFRNIRSAEAAFTALQTLLKSKTRDSIRQVLLEKLEDVLQRYHQEVKKVDKMFEESFENPPCGKNLSPVSGAISWERHLCGRISRPFALFVAAEIKSSDGNWKTIDEYSRAVQSKMRDFEQTAFQDWRKRVDEEAISQLRCPALRHKTTMRGGLMETSLEINHQQYLTRLVKETRCLETLGFEIMPSILALTLQDSRRRTVVALLNHMMERHSELLRTLDPPEAELIGPELKAMMKSMELATYPKYNWLSLSLETYVKKNNERLSQLEALIGRIRQLSLDLHKRVTAMAEVDLFRLPASEITTGYQKSGEKRESDAKLPSCKAYFEKVFEWRNKWVRLSVSNYQAMGPLLRNIEGILCGKSTGRARRMCKYYQFWEAQVYHALVGSISRSLENFGRTVLESNPQWTQSMVLVGNEVVLKPPAAHVFGYLSQCVRECVESAGEFRRWWRGTCTECPVNPKLEDFAAMKSWSSAGTTADTELVAHSPAIGASAVSPRCSTPGLHQAESLSRALSFYQDVCRHPAVVFAVAEVKTHSKRLINQLQGTVTRWRKFRPLWQLDKNRVLQKFLASDPSVTEYEARLHMYSTVIEEARRENHTLQLSCMSLDVRPMIEAVDFHATAWMQSFAHHLRSSAAAKISKIRGKIKEYSSLLQTRPRTLEDLKQVLKTIVDIREQHLVAGRCLFEADEMLYTLRIYNVLDLQEDELQSCANAQNAWYALVEKSKTFDIQLFRVKAKFKRVTNRDAISFAEKCELLREKYITDGPTSVPDDLDAGLALMEPFQEELETFEAERQRIVSAQIQFDLPQMECSTLAEVANEMRDLQKLYGIYSKFKNHLQKWSMRKTSDVQIRPLLRGLKVCINELESMTHGMRAGAVAWVLGGKIKDARDSIKLLELLRSPVLRPRHKQALQTIIGVPTEDIVQNMTMGDVFTLELQQHTNVIQTLVSNAEHELRIEKNIHELNEKWDQIKLQFVCHEQLLDGEEVEVLTGEHELMEMLEDASVQLQHMNASESVLPFADEVKLLQTCICEVEESLLLWTSTQEDLIRLENLLSSSNVASLGFMDSQIFLAEGKRKFEAIRRQYYHMVKAVKGLDCGLLTLIKTTWAAEFKKNLKSLKDALHDIDDVIKRILSKARDIYPKLFLFSDAFVFELLTSSVEVICQGLISKVFPNVAYLRTNGGRTTGKSPAVICAVSSEGEELPLRHPFMIDPNKSSAVWLKNLEAAFQKAHWFYVKRAIYTFGSDQEASKNVSKFLQTELLSVTLAASRVWWTSGVGHSLMSLEQGDAMAMMACWETTVNTCQNVIAEAASVLYEADSGVKNSLLAKKIMALALFHLHARDIVERLVKENVPEAGDFEWLSCVRSYWRKDEDNLFIQQFNVEHVHRHEFLGLLGAEMAFTPATERTIMALNLAAGSNQGILLTGAMGSGRTHVLRHLAFLVGTYLWRLPVPNCSQSNDVESMANLRRFVQGIVQTGFWCYVQSEQSTTRRTWLKLASELSMALRAARRANSTTVQVNRVTIPWNGSSPVLAMICDNSLYSIKSKDPEIFHVAKAFRPIHFPQPDFGVIAKAYLEAASFKNPCALATRVSQVVTLYNSGHPRAEHHSFDLTVKLLRAILAESVRVRREEADFGEERWLKDAFRFGLKGSRGSPENEKLLQDLAGGTLTEPSDGGLLLPPQSPVSENHQTTMESPRFGRKSTSTTSLSAMERTIERIMVADRLSLDFGMQNYAKELLELLTNEAGVIIVGPRGCGKSTVVELAVKACRALRNQERQLGKVMPCHGRDLVVEYPCVHVIAPMRHSTTDLLGSSNCAPLEVQKKRGIVADALSCHYLNDSMDCSGDFSTQDSFRHLLIFDSEVDTASSEFVATMIEEDATAVILTGDRIPLRRFWKIVIMADDLAEVSPKLGSSLPVLAMKSEDPHSIGPTWAKWMNTMAPEQAVPSCSSPIGSQQGSGQVSPSLEGDSHPDVMDPALQFWAKMGPFLEDMKEKYLNKVFKAFDEGLVTGEAVMFNFKVPLQAIVGQVCTLFEGFYADIDTTSGDKDAILKEVEALFLSSMSMTILPMIEESCRPKLDYLIKSSTDMDLIPDSAEKPARMGDLPNATLLSKYSFQVHQKMWIPWKDLKESEDEAESSNGNGTLHKEDDKRDSWIISTLLKTKKSIVVYCTQGQGVKFVVKHYVESFCEKMADEKTPAAERFACIHVDAFTTVSEFEQQLMQVLPQQRKSAIGPANYHKILIIDEVSSTTENARPLLALLKQITDYQGLTMNSSWVEVRNVSFILFASTEHCDDSSLVSGALSNWAYCAPEPLNDEELAESLSTSLLDSKPFESHGLKQEAVEGLAKAMAAFVKAIRKDPPLQVYSARRIFSLCSRFGSRRVKEGTMDWQSFLEQWYEELVTDASLDEEQRKIVHEHLEDACAQFLTPEDRKLLESQATWVGATEKPSGVVTFLKNDLTVVEIAIQKLCQNDPDFVAPSVENVKGIFAPMTRILGSLISADDQKVSFEIGMICGIKGSGRGCLSKLCAEVLGLVFKIVNSEDLVTILEGIAATKDKERRIILLRLPNQELSKPIWRWINAASRTKTIVELAAYTEMLLTGTDLLEKGKLLTKLQESLQESKSRAIFLITCDHEEMNNIFRNYPTLARAVHVFSMPKLSEESGKSLLGGCSGIQELLKATDENSSVITCCWKLHHLVQTLQHEYPSPLIQSSNDYNGFVQFVETFTSLYQKATERHSSKVSLCEVVLRKCEMAQQGVYLLVTQKAQHEVELDELKAKASNVFQEANELEEQSSKFRRDQEENSKLLSSLKSSFQQEKAKVFEMRSRCAKLVDMAKSAIAGIGAIGWAAIRSKASPDPYDYKIFEGLWYLMSPVEYSWQAIIELVSSPDFPTRLLLVEETLEVVSPEQIAACEEAMQGIEQEMAEEGSKALEVSHAVEKWIDSVLECRSVRTKISHGEQNLCRIQEEIAEAEQRLHEADKAANALSPRMEDCALQKKQLEASLEDMEQRGNIAGTQEAFGKQFLTSVEALRIMAQEEYDEEISAKTTALGDCLLTAFSVRYMTRFHPKHRPQILSDATKILQEMEIAADERFHTCGHLKAYAGCWRDREDQRVCSADGLFKCLRICFPQGLCVCLDPDLMAEDNVSSAFGTDMLTFGPNNLDIPAGESKESGEKPALIILNEIPDGNPDFIIAKIIGWWMHSKRFLIIALRDASLSITLRQAAEKCLMAKNVKEKVLCVDLSIDERMMQEQITERILKGSYPNKADLYAAVSRKIPDIRRSLKEKRGKAFQAFAALGEKTSVEDLQQLERFRTAAETARQSLESSEKVLMDIRGKAALFEQLVIAVMSWIRALADVLRLRPGMYRSSHWHLILEVIERVCKEFAEEDPACGDLDKMRPKLLREIFHTACIGLVPEDHSLFAFLLAVEQEKLEGKISENSRKAFLCSADDNKDNFGMDKIFAWMTHEEWNGVMTLVNVCPDAFETLVEDIAVEEQTWKNYLSRGVRIADFPKAVMGAPDVELAYSQLDGPPEPGRCREMAPFIRMVLWISLRPEWALKQLENFVSRVLGPDFVHPLILTRYEEVIRACSKRSIDVVIASDGAWTFPPELTKLIASEHLPILSRGEIEEKEKICFAIFSTLPRPEFSSNLRHLLHRAENLLILRQPPHCDQIQSEEEQKKCSEILEKLALFHAALLERQKYGTGAWHKKFLPFSESDFRHAVESGFQLVNELAGQAFSLRPFHRIIGTMIYGSHMASKSDETIICTYLEQVFDEFGLSGEHSAGLIHDVVLPDRSMGTLLGLCEQDDIDRLRREGKRFLTEVAKLSSDTSAEATDPGVEVLAEEILERLPGPLVIKPPEQKAPTENQGSQKRKKSTVLQGPRDSPVGPETAPESRADSSPKPSTSEMAGETGGAEKEDSGKQQEPDAKKDDEEAEKAGESEGKAEADAGRSSSADNRTSSPSQPQVTSGSPSGESPSVAAAGPKITEVLEEASDFPIKDFWDAEIAAMNGLLAAVRKELQSAGRLSERFIRKYAKDFEKALLANSEGGTLPMGDIVDKWLVYIQKKHRKYDEWVKDQRVPIVQLGLMERPGLFLIAFFREKCHEQDLPLWDQEIILVPTNYQERRDIPPEELEKETFIEGLYLEGAAWDWKEQRLVSPSTEQNVLVELPLLKISLHSRSDTTSAVQDEGIIQVPVHLLPRAALVEDEDRDPVCFAHFPSPLSELRWTLKAVSITTFR